MATCAVSGTLKDPSETVISGATVRANLVRPVFVSTSLLMPAEVLTTSDSSGNFTLNLSQSLGYIVSIEYPPSALESSRRYNYTITTPATTTANLSTLATEA